MRPTTLDLSATPKAVSFSVGADKSESFLSPGEVLYESESPDEAALVYAAKAEVVFLWEIPSQENTVDKNWAFWSRI